MYNTQMLQALQMIGENLDNNIQTDIIYFDFAKAFDSADHGLILAKLKNGINRRNFEWFKDYLTCRTKRVVIDGVNSSWCYATSAVPQASNSAQCYLYYLSMIYLTSSLKIVKLPYMLMTQRIPTNNFRGRHSTSATNINKPEHLQRQQ